MDYRDTINLPSTNFPMKASLSVREPETLKRWEEVNLYKQIREARKGSEKFILHDGPPYANGDIHMGTALNKILKDIIIRYKSLRGYDTPYTPGWDCHGLPIEHKVVEELSKKKKLSETSASDLRKMCREYATDFVNRQREQFKRLGGIGDWENPYLTMSNEYESAIVDTFASLVEKGYIYKGLRPIHWCPTCETALAEAEVEYQEHTSLSVFVTFPASGEINKKLGDNVYVMIWTTTPWTLPANTACAFNESFEYCAVKIEDKWCIMAKGLRESVLSKKGYKFEDMESVDVSIDEIRSLKIKHPFIDRQSQVVFADYVTLETGTGVVHTAPGHGQEDYHTGLAYNLQIISPVDRAGKYTSEFSMMEGEHVFKANPKIADMLNEMGFLYYSEEVSHSYPHCWRSKTPLIFRATEQWFLKISHESLREKTLEVLPSISWFPKWGERRMTDMLKRRPDWCLSRQRHWGVPIPAFYCKSCGETILTPKTARHFASIVKEYSVDIWFSKEASELLPKDTVCKCGSTDFEKENDILDVWFDSGVSSFAVLDQKEDLSCPADLYIEGNDQYRGWFQASIWPSVALRGIAPYKTIVTSGWMLDEKGHAMHKSAGNAVAPEKVTKVYGADILRLWVMSEDFKEDLRLGENLLKITSESYRKIRNTFRYMLGNLSSFNDEDAVEIEKLKEVDRYALSRLHTFLKTIERHLDNYDFHLYYQKLVNYCNTELSSTYFDILKDRLYCDGKKSESRRSALTVLSSIFNSLCRVVAIVMPFTADEAWRSAKGENTPSIHTLLWIESDESLIDEALENKWKKILTVRDDALKALEIAREKGVVKKSLEARVLLKAKDEETKALINETLSILPEIFIVSAVEVVENTDENFHEGEASFSLAKEAIGEKCERCWNINESVGSNNEHPGLCARCLEAIK